jgi:pyrroline-5-carboxylate reductase
MLTDARLAFIGAGVMCEAMIRGLLANDLIGRDAITASHPRRLRLDELASQFQIHTQTDNRAAAAGADIVVLSVKPQVLPAVLQEMRRAIPRGAFVLSIVAGARIKAIADGLGHRAVVRSMPNTPAQVGEGITVWTATPEVTHRQREQARAIMGALGKDLLVAEEGFLDMATAVSGTGPTYVFLLMEALIDAAVHLGFSRADARQLVVQTIRGAALFAQQSSAHPAELRNMVTSPGGTSAAALYELEKGSLRTVLSKAVWAAYQRSVALGQLSRAEVTATSPEENPLEEENV